MQFILVEENRQTFNDATKREKILMQEGCKKLTVLMSNMEFKKKLLHGIIDHLHLVIAHHPDSQQRNYKNIRRFRGKTKFQKTLPNQKQN